MSDLKGLLSDVRISMKRIERLCEAMSDKAKLIERCADLSRQLEDQEAELEAYRQDGGEKINAVLAEIPPALLAQKNKEIDGLKRQLAGRETVTDEPCEWTYDQWNDAYDTDCGQYWLFTDGGPAENNVRYCHYCGGKVALVTSDE